MSLELSSVSKQHLLGKTVVNSLKNLTLSIGQGEFVSVVGPSGSGKSTLLNLIGALDRPTSGSIKINGTETGEMNDRQLARLRRIHIGFIFQSFNLIPMLSVYSNVEFPLVLMKMDKADRRRRVLNIVNRVGLSARLKHKTEELSGGQRQRVAIARALVGNPSIILSDEPTANLDSKTGSEVLNLLYDLNGNNNATLVCATHDKTIISKATRTIELLDGEIVG